MSNSPAAKGAFMLSSCPTDAPTVIPEVSQGFGEGKGNPQSCKKFGEIGTKRGKGREKIMKSCNSPEVPGLVRRLDHIRRQRSSHGRFLSHS